MVCIFGLGVTSGTVPGGICGTGGGGSTPILDRDVPVRSMYGVGTFCLGMYDWRTGLDADLSESLRRLTGVSPGAVDTLSDN